MRAAYRLVHYVAANYWRSMTSSLAIVGTRAWTGGVEAPLKRQCALGERSEIYRQMAESRAETEWHLAGRRGTRAMREAHS